MYFNSVRNRLLHNLPWCLKSLKIRRIFHLSKKITILTTGKILKSVQNFSKYIPLLDASIFISLCTFYHSSTVRPGRIWQGTNLNSFYYMYLLQNIHTRR